MNMMATHCNTPSSEKLQRTEKHRNTKQRAAARCNMLQRTLRPLTAKHCNTSQSQRLRAVASAL